MLFVLEPYTARIVPNGHIRIRMTKAMKTDPKPTILTHRVRQLYFLILLNTVLYTLMRNRDPHRENVKNALIICMLSNHDNATHLGISIGQPYNEEKCME